MRKTGIFTVKSAYRLAMEEKWFSSGNWQSTSRNQTCRPIWKHFWAIPVPHKVLVFGWKFINNGLATQESKRQRTIVSTGSCEICAMEEESATHALVRCGHAQALRQAMRDVWLLPNEHFFLATWSGELVGNVGRARCGWCSAGTAAPMENLACAE